MSDDLCWTSLVGAPTHNLGDLPEKCFTCAAKRREDAERIRRAFREGMTAATPMLVARARARGVLPPERDTSGCCYMVPGGCERHRKPRDPSPGVG